MARLVFDYDPPDRFVAGAVGQPGARTFFLQARSGNRLTSVVLEKAQVAALAERVEELLDEVLRRSGGTAAVPALTPGRATDDDPLDTPLTEDFRVGTMSLAWDPDAERVLIECYAEGMDIPLEPLQPPADNEADDGQILRVSITGTTARAFAQRATAVVAAGRPPCPFCGNPLDPDGHLCPRANGHRR
jgi:uncharacterized repeat protein (TIGR03847 family)